MTKPSLLDSRGRLTIHPHHRRTLTGPIEQVETEEGILLRPAANPPPQEATPTPAPEPTSLSPVEQRS